jgi:hypothetical protein
LNGNFPAPHKYHIAPIESFYKPVSCLFNGLRGGSPGKATPTDGLFYGKTRCFKERPEGPFRKQIQVIKNSGPPPATEEASLKPIDAWGGNKTRASWFKTSIDFVYKRPGVIDMLNDMGCQDYID